MKLIIGVVFLVMPFISVAAGVWTPANKMTLIDEYGNGLRVHGLDLSSNPAQCSSTATALPNTTISDEKSNRYNSIILSAFMAEKNIMLKLSDTTCSGNNPTYYAVRVL